MVKTTTGSEETKLDLSENVQRRDFLGRENGNLCEVYKLLVRQRLGLFLLARRRRRKKKKKRRKTPVFRSKSTMDNYYREEERDLGRAK